MDVTPQLIEQIDFSEKFRGYDPDQVDDFLERVGATIAELGNVAREATARAERAEAELRNAPAPSAPSAPRPAAMSDEEEAAQATRTLLMAKRTADMAIADAREEAQKLVAETRASTEQSVRDAHAEAERLVAEARQTAAELLKKGHEDAEREFGGRRDVIVAEIEQLDVAKASAAEQLGALEQRLDGHRSTLTRVHTEIAALLEGPNSLEPLEPLPFRVEPTPVLASRPEPPRAEPTRPEPPRDFSGDLSTDTATAPVSPDDFFSTSTLLEADSLSTPFRESEQPESDARFGESLYSSAAFSDAPTDSGLFSDTSKADRANGSSGAPESESSRGIGGFTDGSWPNDLDTDDGVPAVAEPWGPGSWAEVSALSETDDSDPFRPAAFSEPDAVTTASHSFNEFPSEGLPVIGQDRYTRDLDQAVNQSEPTGDDAMTAFFEGDDETQTRRFGRRR